MTLWGGDLEGREAGPSIRLRTFAGEAPGAAGDDLGWAAVALDALGELLPVVRPLAVDLQLGCRNHDLMLRDGGASPPLWGWYLRREALPPGVAADPTYVVQRRAEAPDLGRATLLKWVQGALEQRCPDPDVYTPCWTEIWLTSVQARLFDEPSFAGRDALGLGTERGVFQAPLKRDAEGLWVCGPIAGWRVDPPLRVWVTNGDGEGSLDLTVEVLWTPWASLDTPERAALSAALRRIVAQGWWVGEGAGPRAADLLDG